MEKARTTFTSSNPEPQIEKTKDDAKKARGDCDTNPSSSHTQFFKHDRFEDKYNTITRDEYFQESESISTSDTLGCVHGPEGKQYTEKGLLKRNFMKNLDPIVIDRKFTQHCPLVLGWDIVQHLEFLVRDPTVPYQIDRLISHLEDLARTSRDGYRIDLLDSLCVIITYLVEAVYTKSYGARLREVLGVLFENMQSPVRLTAASDVIKYFETLRNYIGYLGYLLFRLEDDDYFDLVSKSLIGLLAMPDQKRGAGTAHLRHTLAAAVPVLHHTTVRLLAVTSSHRFPTFLEIALLLACDSVDNCIEMMKENILENIFYRFNPYFPHRQLPKYDINPADPQDPNIKLGDSSVHMNITLSLLLVLVKTTNAYLEDNPGYKASVPCPDGYAQMCFIWAYRYECRAREHRHQRITLTVIISALLKCFGDRLYQFSPLLMPDILTLTVLTELPPRSDWTGTVNFNTAQSDVQFKKVLMYLCVDFIKAIPYNRNMFVSRYWILGIMYLLDPGLCYLRVRWAPSLYAEIRKTALQAFVCVLPMTPPNVIKEYGLIRRIMWYIEWYSESPYELSTLYWCLRVLQVAISRRHTETRKTSLGDLFDTHGIIILIHLCYTLLGQKLPPVEKSQAIISLCLRLLTSSIEADVCVKCAVYPQIKWPVSINALARKSLDVILYSLRNHNILSDRWLVSLLNFIWQGIIWNKDYRALFVANNGVYKLLDLITMTRAPVQCIALALVCDIARAGDAVSQLITWRANLGASNADPILVKRGSTIGGLLAAIFRDDCRLTGVKLNEYGVIQNLDFPLMSEDLRRATADPACRVGKSQSTSVCLAAGDLAGSRMSKAFAILHLLSEDLAYKVSLADEAYNLYKKIQLAPEDESMLVLCSHYLTMKLNEAWFEVELQCPNLLPQDKDSLEEFCHISKGWAKEIKRQQECVIEKERKKECEEYSLYAFLGRVRLNVALDALREVRCAARSADRAHFTHAMLSDAVGAHHRRSLAADAITDHVIRTYEPPLDDQNMTGQYVKVFSINPKEKPKRKDKQRLS